MTLSRGKWLGIQVAFRYDKNKLQFKNIQSSLPGWDSSTWYHDEEAGILRISWSRINEIPVSDLFVFNFETITTGQLSNSIFQTEDRFPAMAFNEVGAAKISFDIRSYQMREPTAHPNPFHDYLTITDLPFSDNGWQLKIWDMNGRLLHVEQMKDTSKDYPLRVGYFEKPGVYMLELISPNQRYLKRVVKMK